MSVVVQHTPNFYGMTPSHSANLAGAILFGIVLVANLVGGVWYRQWWFATAFVLGSMGMYTDFYYSRNFWWDFWANSHWVVGFL